MDIPVSRLNNRLALQLPAELPLGLVFVVGEVSEVVHVAGNGAPQDRGAGGHTEVELTEMSHRLRCRLTERAAAEVDIKPGDWIRAGGHLSFDPQHADYVLLARDVELVAGGGREIEEPDDAQDEDMVDAADVEMSGKDAHPILDDIAKRSHDAELAQGELPDWVQKIAPPEVKAEMELTGSEMDLVLGKEQELKFLDSDDAKEDTETSGDSTDQILAYLAEIMDDEEDVELAPEMISDLSLGGAYARASVHNSKAYEVPEPKAEDVAEPEEMLEERESFEKPVTVDPQPTRQPRRFDPLTIVLIIATLIFIAAVAVNVISQFVN